MVEQAIKTKYVCPGNVRGSRISATAETKRIFVEYDDALNLEENHIAAATKLAESLGWLKHGELISGILKNRYYVHILVPKKLECVL
jgi:hypothetical protein